ncbi:flavin-containing monooxygenase [Nocardia sp. NPDC058176]|uniref:flavin-containing monooxygenase n=1 Tax=Nocardia sp. NPDC058176 TaxID=3346368 RepID=UPI0036DA2ADF
MTHRYCIIGAGYTGLAVAKAYTDLGLDYDQLEATDAIGGNWSHGVYDSTHLISSKDVTEYADHPMPADYPDFPSAAQMRDYTGVVVANGHCWDTHIPTYPGEYTGKQIHSKDYRRPADLAGERVLVVGAGNSGCDLAVEAALTFGTAELSLRRAYWFIPKYVFGIPSSRFDVGSVPIPKVLQETAFRSIVALGMGSFGLDKPRHRIFDQDLVVNQQLPYFLKHGQPRLIAHTFAPGLANLYFAGLVAPRSGAGALLTNASRLLAEAALVQQRINRPVSELSALVTEPSAQILAGGPELRWEILRGRFLVDALAKATTVTELFTDRPTPPLRPPAALRPILSAIRRAVA